MNTSAPDSWRVTTTAELPVMPPSFHEREQDFYFPINSGQVSELLGKMLTHVESMNLPASVEKANKDLIRQSIWGWFSDVQENSLASYRGVLAPIVLEPSDITEE